jgi:hypothetical protein
MKEIADLEFGDGFVIKRWERGVSQLLKDLNFTVYSIF